MKRLKCYSPSALIILTTLSAAPLFSALAKSESRATAAHEATTAYSTDEGNLFTVKLSDGTTLELLDVNGLGYLGDMILGETEELKRYGLDIANADGTGSYDHVSDDNAPSAAIRYPTSGYKWPGGIVPYQIDGSLSSQARQDFLYAVEHWNNNTQVQLIPRTNQQDYLSIVGGGGCSSWIGRSGGRQTLTLARNCGKGAAVHEIGHAVGFFHEQTRTDRDNYVEILWQNIQSNMSYNFQKINQQQGMDFAAYDYYSIMHYRTNAFGINNRTTILIRDDNVDSRVVGNSQVLSAGDLAAAAHIYGDNIPKECNVVNLQNGQPLTISGETQSHQCFTLALPENSESYQVTTMANNGDADLFVRHNDVATRSVYDCKSDGETSNESCTGSASGGFIHAYVYAYQAFEELTITASYTTPEPCEANIIHSGQTVNVSAIAKSSHCFKLTVPEGISQVEFTTNGGSGDADLYVKKGSEATLELFDCKSSGETSSENCTLEAQPGDYYVRVYAWDNIENVQFTNRLLELPDNTTRYVGELSTNDEVDIQPDGSWFEYGGGRLNATLEASQPADLELVLQRWNGRDKVWYDLADSTNPDSNENIDQEVSAGYYRYKIFSWNSESKSDYILTVVKE